eukprot:scaffold4.g4670.t1
MHRLKNTFLAGDAMSSALLMGRAPGEMNLAQLRARAEDLRRTLDQLIHLLQFAPERLSWSDVLDRLTVVNVQYQQLQAQLRPMLRHWVAHPKSVNQANATVLPIMLATKLLPEQEAEAEAQLAEFAAGGAAAPAEAPGGPPLPLALDLALVRQRCEAWNTAVESLEAALAPRASQPRREAAPAPAAAKAARPAGAAATAAAAAGRLAGAAGATGPREELQGPELLLAAASYGAGL